MTRGKQNDSFANQKHDDVTRISRGPNARISTYYWFRNATNFTISENTYFSSDDPSLSFYQLSWENSTTRLANASYLDFVWGYAMSSPYEDFAEAFTMYIWHNEVFKQRAAWSTVLQKKYNFMHNLTQGQSLSNSTTNIQNNISWRPWDVTRISLE